MNKKVHFIGIGGIGLSALARFLFKKGYEVSGSDVAETTITKALQEEGIKVTIPHNKDLIDDQDIVYSAVIKDNNVELRKAEIKGLNVYSRKEALKWILADHKVYAVCGAHGKSTTSAILSSLLKKSMLIGAISKEFASNMFYDNSSDILVFESDESDASFLNSNAYCSIVTNTEPEHMEYYNYDTELFYECYEKFICDAKISVLNNEDEFISTLKCENTIKLNPKSDIKNVQTIIKNNEPYTKFELQGYGEFMVWGIGYHIVLDASLAIIAALNELDIEEIRVNLLDYKGIKKRFDVLVKNEDIVIVDDYGHHPTEIKVSLHSAKIYQELLGINKIIAIWQPHKYCRTIDNMDAFKKCFSGIDELYILPVWSVGEEKMDLHLEEHFKQYNPIFIDSVKREGDMLNIIQNNQIISHIDSGLIIGFGAGDITYQLRL